MINTLDLPSQGIYTSSIKYEDSELFSIINYFCIALNVPDSYLLRAFGEYLFKKLIHIAPPEARTASSLRVFLKMVDKLIHVEVKKLYADSNLPDFEYQENKDNYLTMIYKSERKLCYLSEGLIIGASKYFDEPVEVSQSQCMHDGFEPCHIEVKFL